MLLIDRIPVRFRLSLGHAVWMAVLFLGVGFGLYRVVETRLLDSVDAALLASARSIRDARFNQDSRDTPVEIFFKHFFKDPMYVDQFFSERFVRPYAQLISISGKVQSKTTNLRVTLPVTPTAVSRAELGLVTFEDFHLKNRPPLRQITLPVMRNDKFTGELVQVGAPLDDIYQNLQGVSKVLWIGFPIGLIFSVFFGYLLAWRALTPVRNISKAASGLGIDDLSVRLPLPNANDELRQLSITFNEMLDRLEEAVQRLRRFTGDVSHELRTSLAVLRGEAELALRRPRTEESYQTTLKTVASEAVHMTGIIEDLLLLARAESKSVALNWVEINGVSFCKDAAALTKNVYTSKNVELVTQVADEGLTFSGSQNFLSLAIKNILENAAKHSCSGSKVFFSLRQNNDTIIFEITDHGEGIPAESLPLIFDSFYRADTARNRAAGGVGIGLSLAKALIMLHNGTIKVTSTLGSGSKFTISIPKVSNLEYRASSQKKLELMAPGKLPALATQ
jgi:signal transduction histidine kinase